MSVDVETVDAKTQEAGKVVTLAVTGRLTKDDYARFVPELERHIREHGPIRLIMELHDFKGWTAGAMWEDLKFDVRHFADVERFALVGDRAWERGLAEFCKPFTKAKVRYFDESERDVAERWVAEG